MLLLWSETATMSYPPYKTLPWLPVAEGDERGEDHESIPHTLWKLAKNLDNQVQLVDPGSAFRFDPKTLRQELRDAPEQHFDPAKKFRVVAVHVERHTEHQQQPYWILFGEFRNPMDDHPIQASVGSYHACDCIADHLSDLFELTAEELDQVTQQHTPLDPFRNGKEYYDGSTMLVRKIEGTECLRSMTEEERRYVEKDPPSTYPQLVTQTQIYIEKYTHTVKAVQKAREIEKILTSSLQDAYLALAGSRKRKFEFTV